MFIQSLHLYSYFVHASSEGSDESEHILIYVVSTEISCTGLHGLSRYTMYVLEANINMFKLSVKSNFLVSA